MSVPKLAVWAVLVLALALSIYKILVAIKEIFAVNLSVDPLNL